ncbi:MAG: class I SAM-dependent methyltransferase [Alphaproteobacteria bacterium]|nr:class I SAM-dependent methyltransferase [Alphaproteobacteria bacterium]
MSDMNRDDAIAAGIRAGDSLMQVQDEIWARYSSDKVDIGRVLTSVLRTLSKAVPLEQPLRALSVGSSEEPQFRILNAAFAGGLYLLDIEQGALDVAEARVRRQSIGNVTTICGDYSMQFATPETTRAFLQNRLDGQPVDLILLQHSFYYADEATWPALTENLFRTVLSEMGAMHLVLMSPKAVDRDTTTWLYDHFVGKFYGRKNTQDLLALRDALADNGAFAAAQLLSKTTDVRFWVDDFAQFMAVIWMIMLYPNVHDFDEAQKQEITQHVYDHFWLPKKPLRQTQDHLVIYKGIDFPGLI